MYRSEDKDDAPLAASRRGFLKGAAASAVGLTIGFHWSGGMRLAEAAGATPFAPNAFVRITPDNKVTVMCKYLEMGQGTHTGVSTIVADELDADWAQVSVEGAPADAKLYGNQQLGGVQGTGGSTAMADAWMELRKAGATARAMLVAAAAQEWKVPVAQITVDKGVVHHAASKRQATFGDLCVKASAQTAPSDVKLKDPKHFKLIGHVIPRKDTAGKINGAAVFGIDVTLPGQLVAVIQRPPRFGGTVKSVDSTATKKIAGVVDVVQVPAGVAVVAKSFWAAKQGREALKVEWDETNAEKRGSAELMAEYKELAKQPGASAKKAGDADAALAKAAKKISASFEFPYLAHAPMEPLDAVVKLTADSCEIWAGDQFQTIDQANAAGVAGLKPEQVKINTIYAGGSFGRRANPPSDYIVEAVSVAKALGATGAPVKLQWTREDDIRGGRYRPMYYHAIEGGLDAKGNLVAWKHRIVGQSLLTGTPFEEYYVKDGVDESSVEGAADSPYAIPNIAIDLHSPKVGVPVLWWRSVGHTHTAYAVESFVDQLAHEAGRDPVEFRKAMLKGQPRYLKTLELAAEKADWHKKLPTGHARGVALHKSFDSYVAQVVEISVAKDGKIKVERVVAAVDCGVAINPDVIKAQVEGGVGFGLGAALYGAVTLKDGQVEQSNFDAYRVLRMEEMPKVEVHIAHSTEAPTGIGEPGVPPVGPALANAIFAATGKRVTKLPIVDSGLSV
jgi:isoquinoline 1-oxidoreductase beta subunit